MLLEKMAEERHLPPLGTREEMQEILQREEYGYLPAADAASVSFRNAKVLENRAAPNGAMLTQMDMTVENEHGKHTIPVHYLSIPDGKKHPLFIFLSFSPMTPNRYYPVEMIAERGFHVLSFCYQEATADNGDFSNGVAPLLLPGGQKKGTDCGKIAMWAWCAMRILDYAAALPEIDMSQAAIIGHSRLGKTALYAGMMDPRFRYVFSNNAGCSGDALTRGNLGLRGEKGPYGGTGETIADITRRFPYWFCPNYQKYAQNNVPDDFDQHFLLAAIAPRFVSVSASAEDDWADPVSEQLCCVAAGKQWEKLGLPGFVHQDRLLEPGQTLPEGRVAFSLRAGAHFLSCHNWQWDMDFMERHKEER